MGGAAGQTGDRSGHRGRGTWSVAAVVEGAGQSGMVPELNEAAWREGRWASSIGPAPFFGLGSCWRKKRRQKS